MSEIHNPGYAAEVIRIARQMVDSPQYAVVNLDALREALRAYRDAPTVPQAPPMTLEMRQNLDALSRSVDDFFDRIEGLYLFSQIEAVRYVSTDLHARDRELSMRVLLSGRYARWASTNMGILSMLFTRPAPRATNPPPGQ